MTENDKFVAVHYTIIAMNNLKQKGLELNKHNVTQEMLFVLDTMRDTEALKLGKNLNY